VIVSFPSLKRLTVRSLNADVLQVQWEFGQELEGTSVWDLQIQILRSESSEGPWTAVSPTFRDKYSFVDTTIPVANRYRQLHYKLQVTHIPTGQVREYGPANQEALPDLIALEIRNNMLLLYKEFSGRPCWLFPIRTFGPRCPNCWDPRLRNRSKSRCESCYGTSFLHGYLSPILCHVDINPSANGEQPSTMGKNQQNNTTASLGWYPQVKPGDVLVEAENRRWRVISQTQTEQLRSPVSQDLELNQIDPADIEMALPLREEELDRNLWLAPPRNFSNPHTLESSPDQILQLYPQLTRGTRL
jgi:hypothetical protein